MYMLLVSSVPQSTSIRRIGSLGTSLGGDNEGLPPPSSGELTRSMTSSASAVSTRSDVTLVHEDDTETVVDEGERPRGLSTAESMDNEGERSRKNTLTEDNRGGEREDEKKMEQVGDANPAANGLEKDGLEGEEVGGGAEREGEGGGEVCSRHMSVVFRQELLNTVHLKMDSRIGLEIAKLSDPQYDVVQLIGRCLPHIVPNVILAKREVR